LPCFQAVVWRTKSGSLKIFSSSFDYMELSFIPLSNAILHVCFPHNFTLRYGHYSDSLYFPTFKNVGVHCLPVRLRGNCALNVWINYCNISIRTFCNNSFSWVEVEYFCTVCTSNCNVFILCDFQRLLHGATRHSFCLLRH